ncbi:GH19582 [Drosophila grimshawi]|uniref:GH19582 n=2 Tax=Drosophila grimshawi TaxID=7222 RepID=B4JHQ9_DROGR|nr:GH19582 [Drosophila grimshawi]
MLTIVAQNDTNRSLGIYIYDLNQFKKEGFSCLATAILPTTSRVTLMQVAIIGPDKTYALGIGFERGDILLYFGKINRDLSSNICQQSIATSAINGIEFNTCYQQSETQICNVFVMSLDGVYSLVLNDRSSIIATYPLGSDRDMHNQCCTMSEPLGPNSFFVVGRDDAIYCFSRDGRGGCSVIAGQKEFLSWIGHHLLVVVKAQFGSRLIVVDVHNKLILFNERISNLLCILNATNAYHIITKGEHSQYMSTYHQYKLQQHNTNYKVRLLIAQCLHDKALSILEKEASAAESENIANVRLQHGNNLLQRGRLSEAVTEYAQTIGEIKPYNIISKLLSLRHNGHLMQYMNELLKNKHASIEHKKLLECCVDREKLSSKIDEFWITRNDSGHICDFRNISLRSLNISSLKSASEYLQTTDFQQMDEDEIYQFFQEYGRELISLDSQKVFTTAESLVKTHKIKNVLRFLTIFSNYEEFCAKLIADLIESSSNCDEKLSYYLLTLYLGLWRENKISSEYIRDFLKKTSLSSQKIAIISKAYQFTHENGYPEAAGYSEVITGDETNSKCIEETIKKNPSLAPVLTTDQRSLLNILQKVCSNSEIKIIDIKPFLIETFTKNANDVKAELQLNNDLKNEIDVNDALVSQFKSNPMEFRNRGCDICRQPLHMPSVYFLCQHSFHKDCLSYDYSTNKGDDNTDCVLCAKNTEYFLSNSESMNFSSKSGNTIKTISNDFASGLFKLRISDKFRMAEASHGTRDSTNPFDDNYDSNFNCC